GNQQGFDSSLRQAQSKLDVLKPWVKQFTIRAAGNSHIDMAWLWPWTETVEVVRDTFRSALDLMREYPDFKFSMSSARTYAWMEDKYPDLFGEIQRRVKEGRWEIVGGMWVEPDLNMPGGESLVRQILVGKRYFQQKFDVDVKIGWNPDSFGYNWQLPQIYKKSGIDIFVTQKLMWAHEFTTFPYKMFWWEAPDGSRLLTYFPHDYAMGIDPVQLGQDASLWIPSLYGANPAGKCRNDAPLRRGRPRRRPHAHHVGHGHTLAETRCCVSQSTIKHRGRFLPQSSTEIVRNEGASLARRTLLRIPSRR